MFQFPIKPPPFVSLPLKNPPLRGPPQTPKLDRVIPDRVVLPKDEGLDIGLAQGGLVTRGYGKK